MPSPPLTVWSLGHSTHTLEGLLAVLAMDMFAVYAMSAHGGDGV